MHIGRASSEIMAVLSAVGMLGEAPYMREACVMRKKNPRNPLDKSLIEKADLKRQRKNANRAAQL